jgi:hypothetical protein
MINQKQIYNLSLQTVTDRSNTTSNDIVFNDATKGIILKDTQGTPHYWRITINNSGVLQTTDLGTSLP